MLQRNKALMKCWNVFISGRSSWYYAGNRDVPYRTPYLYRTFSPDSMDHCYLRNVANRLLLKELHMAIFTTDIRSDERLVYIPVVVWISHIKGNGYNWNILCHFQKGRQLVWSKIASTVNQALSKNGYTLEGENLLLRSKLFPSPVDPNWQGMFTC